jgi:hypothetical protein
LTTFATLPIIRASRAPGSPSIVRLVERFRWFPAVILYGHPEVCCSGQAIPGGYLAGDDTRWIRGCHRTSSFGF